MRVMTEAGAVDVVNVSLRAEDIDIIMVDDDDNDKEKDGEEEVDISRPADTSCEGTLKLPSEHLVISPIEDMKATVAGNDGSASVLVWRHTASCRTAAGIPTAPDEAAGAVGVAGVGKLLGTMWHIMMNAREDDGKSSSQCGKRTDKTARNGDSSDVADPEFAPATATVRSARSASSGVVPATLQKFATHAHKTEFPPRKSDVA